MLRRETAQPDRATLDRPDSIIVALCVVAIALGLLAVMMVWSVS